MSSPDDTQDGAGGGMPLHRTEHHPAAQPQLEVRRFRLTVVEGATARVWESSIDRCSVGSYPSNDLRVHDETVSRFHCEIRVTPDGAVVRDLGSRNGTVLDGVRVKEAYLREGSLLQLGKTTLRFDLAHERNPLPITADTHFGSLVGQSVAARATFALLQRAAASDATVLLQGETGTGKGAAAESIDRESRRRDGPFLIVDCAAIPPNLLESELFGHEKGAFTGASGRRIGAFEDGDGGTLFLDEIGELPPELQPKLLRALEDRTVRRVGANVHRPIDVRLIAATNRDLRTEVNEKRFRADLFFRLAVLRIAIPPLRERPDDIPLLVERLLSSMRAPASETARLQTPDVLARLRSSTWPGNVRELRNHLERQIALVDPTAPEDAAAAATAPDAVAEPGGPAPDRVPFLEARRRFERAYLDELIAAYGSRTVQAAAAAGLDRVYLYRLLRRYGMR